MKLAKKSGKLEIYRPGVLREARHRFNLESNLREALAKGRLELAFHPLIDLQNGAVTGFEALSRWNDAGQGQISPVEFIPVAEESGLINPLGRWAMRSEEHTSELQSLMRISYAVFCLKKKTHNTNTNQ